MPYPSPLHARTLGTIAVAWSATAYLLEEVRRLCVADGRWASVATAAVAVVLLLAAGRHAFAATSRKTAMVRLAVAESVLVLAQMAVRGHMPVPLWAIPFGLLGVLPVWLAFAAALIVPVWPSVEAGSQEDADRAMIVAALWVALPTIVTNVIGAAYMHTFGSPLLAVLNIGLPLALAIVGGVRISSRRRWVEAVASGAHPGWRIIDAPAGRAALPALVRVGKEEPGSLLVRVHAAGQPFREAERLEEVAIVRGRGKR
jgi:hypothetical protein